MSQADHSGDEEDSMNLKRHRQQCEGKIRHRDFESADLVAFAMTQKKGEPFHAYECGFCRSWHVGHQR